ncbi:MAG: hypothetical protein IKF96_01490, partial [Eggerthellaceae bacterium]|nr:hypothetical protein [Eggerthellaceae bacterium]
MSILSSKMCRFPLYRFRYALRKRAPARQHFPRIAQSVFSRSPAHLCGTCALRVRARALRRVLWHHMGLTDSPHKHNTQGATMGIFSRFERTAENAIEG